MAILPNPDELGRVAPQPKGSVASYRPVMNTTVSRAGEITANSEIEAGQRLTAMADEAVQKLDALKAADAETKLMRRELELQTEYNQVKGGDVLKEDFHKGYQEKYQQSVSEIASGLSTPNQKAQFEQQAKRRAVSFDAHRINYAVGEADKYEGQVYNGRMEAITQQAQANYAKPDVVASSVLQAETTFGREMVRKGITDPDVLAVELKKVRGNLYANLIDHALTENDTAAANSFYAASKGLLSDEQRHQLESRMKPANDFAEGQSLAVEAQGMLSAGKTPAEVEMYVAKKATSPGAYSAAQVIFTNIQQANDKVQKEGLGAAYMLYENAGSNAKARATVLGSQEFQRLAPTQQAQVIQYMETDHRQDLSEYRSGQQFAWSQEAHADAKKAKAQEVKYSTPEVMAKFSNIIQDPNLKNKSRQELWALAPEIGPTLVNKVLAEHELLGKSEKPLSIDKDLLEAGKPSDLKKDKKTASNDAYDGFVKSTLLDWQKAHPGKQPTADEQKAIIRAANTEYTTEGRLFGTSTYKAYEEGPSGKRAGEAEIKRGIIQAAAARGKTLTTEQINAAYAGYLKDHP